MTTRYNGYMLNNTTKQLITIKYHHWQPWQKNLSSLFIEAYNLIDSGHFTRNIQH